MEIDKSKRINNLPDILKRKTNFIGDLLNQNSLSDDFPSYIADLLQNIVPENNNSSQKQSNSKLGLNAFYFLNNVAKFDLSNQLVMALGFIYSDNDVFKTTGDDFIKNVLNEAVENPSIMKRITHKSIEKCYFYLLHSKQSILLPEKSDSNQTGSNNTNTNLNQSKTNIDIDYLVKKLSKIANSNEWSSQSSTPTCLVVTEKLNEKERMIGDKQQTLQLKQSLEFPSFNPCTNIQAEKLAFELGPSILVFKKDNFNKPKQKNGSVILENPAQYLYDFNFNEKRLADLIVFISNNFTYQEEKEQRILLKLFLKNISSEMSSQVEENLEKKVSLNWNIDAFFKAHKSTIENLNPNLIFQHFDHPDFSINDKKSLDNFISIISKLKLPNLLFKALFCNGPWINIDNQLSIIAYLINNPNDIIKNYSNNRQVKKNPNFPFDYSSLKSSPLNNYLIEVWSNLDVVGGLLNIAKGDYMFKVKTLFEWPNTNIPETILLELFQLPNDNFLYNELLKELVPVFLSNHNNSNALLDELWLNDQSKFIDTFSYLNKAIPETVNMNKILDLTQKIKDSLMPMVSSHDDYFSICLATLAIKRDFLHIDQWLNNRIQYRGDAFIIPLLQFIKLNVISEYRKKLEGTIKNSKAKSMNSYLSNNINYFGNNNNPNSQQHIVALKDQILEKSQLTIEAIAIIFEHLSVNTIQSNPKVSKATLSDITIVYKQIFEIFEELHSHPPSSVETEEKANLLFRKLFNDETSIKSLTEQMKIFKESNNKKDNEVFACMLHSMLDEYRFFIKYPDKELILMGCLFGQIIDLRLIDGVIENIALRYIVDGFKRQQGKLILFSVKAVEQLINKITTWPSFLEELYRITRTYQGELYDKIAAKYDEYIKSVENVRGVSSNNSNFPNNQSGASIENFNLNTNPNNNNISITNRLMMNSTPYVNSSMIPSNNTNKSANKNNKFNSPSDNLVMNNMQGGYQNMYPPVYNMNANYIPSEKTQLNANQRPFNPSNISSKQTSSIAKELNYNANIKLIKKVYTSDMKFKESNQITALKNLAASLSDFTFAKNKPLLAKDINLKDMIIEAYKTGKLVIAVSFVSKYLEMSIKSKIFHNKNPWINSIISLLTELHRNKNIVNVIKKDIEALFKILDLDIAKHEATALTNDLPIPLNSPDFIASPVVIEPTKQINSNLNLMEAKYEEILKLMESHKIESFIASLCEHIKSQIASKELEKHFKNNTEMNQELFSIDNMTQMITTALLNAINQILFLVVERTINISLTTTRELVMKDFAFNPDADKFKKAVILSVKSLSGSLANVTCKDPLRQGFINQIKEQLTKLKLEFILDIVKSHNCTVKVIEIGCFYIKEYVIKKSVEKADRDETLSEEFKKRQSIDFVKNLENSEYSKSLQQKMLSLPPFLRPNNNKTSDPMKIYQDFEKLNISKE